jgi:hypothetical protein
MPIQPKTSTIRLGRNWTKLKVTSVQLSIEQIQLFHCVVLNAKTWTHFSKYFFD